jgi:hypothetical protein
MPLGPGKYDEECTYVREKTSAACAIVIILGGNKGQGCAVQCEDPNILARLPEILRKTADDIDASFGKT